MSDTLEGRYRNPAWRRREAKAGIAAENCSEFEGGRGKGARN
jgi:hypothetical protein